ncbi:MAG: B12-binding domain-containing radical SAM protein [Saccharofermentanales bacterium]
MKILLVALNATYCHTNLAVRYIESYFRRHFTARLDYVIEFAEFSINDPHERIIDILYEAQADFYGFSCYIWNITPILEITSDLKLIFPDKPIILGGPEISYENSGFLMENPQIDYLIQGQGMKSFTDLITRLVSGSMDGDRIIQGESTGLAELSFPYADVDAFLPEKQYYYETSTGCPFQCSYCLSAAGTGVDYLSFHRVREELDQFIQKGAGIVKLVDRTFNFDDRRAALIWKYLIERYIENPFDTIFHFEISADLLQTDTMELLAAAPKGIFRFECGVQTTDNDVLMNVNRRSDQKKLFQILQTLSDNGNIELHLDLIAGLPGESPDSFRKSFNDVFSILPDMLQLGFLKMLKGSRILNDKDQFKIVSSSYPPYMVISTDTLSFGDLSAIRKIGRVLDAFYNSDQFRYSARFLIRLFFPDDPYAFFGRLADAFEAAGGFERTISRKDRILLFHRFGSSLAAGACAENFCCDPSADVAMTDSDSAAIFTDLMKFDYYRFDKKGSIPQLKMNLSERHPLMTSEESTDFMSDADGRSLCMKARIEYFSFNVDLLISENRVFPGRSFILYDLSGDKPLIIKTLNIN